MSGHFSIWTTRVPGPQTSPQSLPQILASPRKNSGHGLQNDSDIYRRYLETVEAYLDTYLPVSQDTSEL